MPRYIEATEAIRVLSEYYHHRTDTQRYILAEAISKVPTADVVEKERYYRLLENANILADAVRKYQTADVVERKDIEAECELAYKHGYSDCFAERRWIPVTERLPEEGRRVLVTYDLVNRYPWVNILRYGKPIFEDKPCFYEVDSEWGDVPYDGIVAWMPLPEPYRKETDDGEIH